MFSLESHHLIVAVFIAVIDYIANTTMYIAATFFHLNSINGLGLSVTPLLPHLAS
jgi:hypothetical protein